MFSVIIPLYNKADYIEKAVATVLDQTFADFELIIVNDGSSDSSLNIVERFKDRRIKILNQQNQGVSVARNNGVKAAKYDYIAFLDADDWWDKRFLEEMNKLIEKFPEAGVYGNSFKIVKNGQERIPNIGLPKGFTKGYIDYIRTYAHAFVTPFNCSFVIVKKDAFKAIGGFNSALKFGEDFDLWVRMSLEYKVAYSNTPLAFSNQDVDNNHRALGQEKQWIPREHFIFNLDYLKEEENRNPSLKELLDGLRVRSLIRFRINRRYKDEVNKVLKQVDFSRQSAYFRRIYHWPASIVISYFKIKTIGSNIKQMLKIKS